VKPIQYIWCSLYDHHPTDVLDEVKFFYDNPIALSANPIVQLVILEDNLIVKEVIPSISEENGEWVLIADFDNTPFIPEKGYTIIIPEGTLVTKDGDVIINQRNAIAIESNSSIDNIENKEVSVSCDNRVITIEQIAKKCDIRLFTTDGIMINSSKSYGENVYICAPTAGIYLLSINSKIYKIAVR
jgi:hypothetical protein